MTCKRCKEAYADGKPIEFGSEPKCAFETETFSSDNWQCQTMNALREMVEDTVAFNDDQWAAIICVPSPTTDEERAARVADFIFLGWYKQRGRTEAAYIAYMLDQDHPIMPLTLAVAEKVLEKK